MAIDKVVCRIVVTWNRYPMRLGIGMHITQLLRVSRIFELLHIDRRIALRFGIV